MCKIYSKYKNKLRFRITRWRIHARARNVKWDLTYKYIESMLKRQKGLCYYTNKLMTFEPGSEYLISLDRIDSDKGYIKGNVRLSCWDANNMKSTYTHTKFVRICNVISKVHPKKVKVNV